MTAGGCVRQFDPTSRQITDLLAGQPGSVGPLALADVDGDGDLDLFVWRAGAGRSISGTVPRPCIETRIAIQPRPGKQSRVAGALVSGAVFSDLENDGFRIDLACVGPIRIFQMSVASSVRGTRRFGWWMIIPRPNSRNPSRIVNRNVPKSQPSTLNPQPTYRLVERRGDRRFRRDGNSRYRGQQLGRNSKKASARPLRLYYGDVDGRGPWIFRGALRPSAQKLVPERMLDVMTRAIPALAERFVTRGLRQGERR